MKKIICFLLIAGLALNTFAQLPTGNTTGLHSKAHKVITLGAINDNGTIGVINPNKTDTLYSADTLFYKVLVNHTSEGYPYLSINTKVGTTDTTKNTTSTITFWQSVDGVNNWQQITQVSQTTTLLYDTTMIVKPANGILFDTTRIVEPANLQIWDTTKQTYGRGGKFDLLYQLKTTSKGQFLYAASSKNKGSFPYYATGTVSKTESVYSGTVKRSYNNGVATPGNEFSFWRNNLKFESQYLGIRFIAGTSSGAKLVYTGSVRFNKAN
jgi:hypothetical protein